MKASDSHTASSYLADRGDKEATPTQVQWYTDIVSEGPELRGPPH